VLLTAASDPQDTEPSRATRRETELERIAVQGDHADPRLGGQEPAQPARPGGRGACRRATASHRASGPTTTGAATAPSNRRRGTNTIATPSTQGALGLDLCLMIEGQEGVTWPQWRALAEACEQHGIPTLFRSDHYQNLDGQHPERGSLDAWGTIIALSALTTTLRLGTLVTPASFRHPSVLAKLVVTADHVSNGRIDLGLGAGWHDGEHAAYGFPFLPAAERVDVLEEQLRVLIGTWGEEEFSFEGERYALAGLNAQPKPVQRPRPPILMGGNAGSRSAGLAAQFADEYNTPFPSLEQIRQRKANIDRACERAGRQPIPFSIMAGTILGADSDEVQRRAQRVADATGLDAAALLSDPPQGWIVGTIEQAADQLAPIREAGVSRVMCNQFVEPEVEQVARLGELASILA
jgi:alkanesulfonate monooxygenase SsuD/methylene tetrahydromethanopterin reductase-like flavin-dependent oxidoreductase (luciferase family)